MHQINSSKLVKNAAKNINNTKKNIIKDNYRKTLQNSQDQRPILTSDLSQLLNELSDNSFLYQYKSKNYYGTLDITDYQPSISNFNEFQEPENVNIKGLPWEDSPFILSFVFPVYNKVTFLDRVFNSILDFANNPLQNPLKQKFEFIIVDANSDDGSYEYAINLAKTLNNPSNANNHKKLKEKKPSASKSQNNLNMNYDQNSIRSAITKFLTGRYNHCAKKSFRYRNSLISFHHQEQIEKQSENFRTDQQSNLNSNDSINQGSNVKVRVIRRNEKTLSVIARQIGVEYSTGRYVWQIDPDDEVVTSSLAAIVDELRKEIEEPEKFQPNKNSLKNNNYVNSNDMHDNDDSNNKFNRESYIKGFEETPEKDIERKSQNDAAADMVEIGYCQYTYQDGVLPEVPNCFPRYSQRIVSNYEIAERLVTTTTSWQLWQCIIKRDTFLKAIESIKLHSPNQTQIIVADDLFIYSATAYHAKVLKEVNLIGYFYYYMNPNSESLKIYKDNLNTRLSAKVIVSFMHYLYDGMKLEFNQRYSEL